ncbi:MAG: hypothetical protein OWQ54_08120 [Sulfolobaceae archaeon]|nr:hypothetical protein [Sulfolobaceae archaeon]
MSSYSEQRQQSSTKIITVIKCMTCDYTVEREMKDGDFVLKVEGKCPKDNGTLYIAGIYAETTQPQSQKK